MPARLTAPSPPVLVPFEMEADNFNPAFGYDTSQLIADCYRTHQARLPGNALDPMSPEPRSCVRIGRCLASGEVWLGSRNGMVLGMPDKCVCRDRSGNVFTRRVTDVPTGKPLYQCTLLPKGNSNVGLSTVPETC